MRKMLPRLPVSTNQVERRFSTNYRRRKKKQDEEELYTSTQGGAAQVRSVHKGNSKCLSSQWLKFLSRLVDVVISNSFSTMATPPFQLGSSTPYLWYQLELVWLRLTAWELFFPPQGCTPGLCIDWCTQPCGCFYFILKTGEISTGPLEIFACQWLLPLWWTMCLIMITDNPIVSSTHVRNSVANSMWDALFFNINTWFPSCYLLSVFCYYHILIGF